MQLFRVRLLLEEGQSEQALTVLETLQTDTEKQQQEQAYFLGWGYVLQKRWHDALRILLPFSHYREDTDEQAERINREWHTRCLLYLGYAAINISHFEDAERHLRACLNALQGKQLQRPDLQLWRIRAHYSLALTYNMRSLYLAALQHYEEALRLFLYEDNDEELGNIYYGLCDTYRKAGRLREAQLAGEKALQLYERTSNRSLEGRMRNQLGHIALLQDRFKEAGVYFTEALAIATSMEGVQMVMLNCAALAKLRLAEGQFAQASRYSQRALEMSRRSDNDFLRGLTYMVAGQVALGEAQQTEDEQHKYERLEEAMERFEMAHRYLSSTDAYAERAETCILWAQACEAVGRSQESLHHWRAAYQTLSQAKGLGWDEIVS
jgi:tetratricopeptide (TPR) repeat protein